MLCIMIMQTQGNEAYQVTQAQLKEQGVLKIHVQGMKKYSTVTCVHTDMLFCKMEKKNLSSN